jgi:anthranilate phosphoribosyltransferase
MIKQTITKAINRENLSEPEMRATMADILDGAAPPVLIGAFLTALRMKEETVEEITAAARVVREKARKIDVSNVWSTSIGRRSASTSDPDTCGTGGDGTSTFNISPPPPWWPRAPGCESPNTAAAACPAPAAAPMSSSSLVNLDVPPTAVETCIRQIGIGFHEPLSNTAMTHIAGCGASSGFTSFNLLGPLTNPAGASIRCSASAARP